MNNVGTGRNVPPDTRTSRNPAGTFPNSAPIPLQPSLYTDTIDNLFATYQRTTAAVHDALTQRVACPETMKPEAYDRTLKARAFDVARYLLPLATNTSLGQIVNARTLETQVSRLLSHPIAEVRDLGKKLRDAATGPAWNVNAKAAAAFVEKLASNPDLAAEAANLLTREVRTAPTLVKYAEPNAVPHLRPAPKSNRPPVSFSTKLRPKVCPTQWSISSSAPKPSKSN